MDMNGVGFSLTQNAVGESPKDVEKQIEMLEEKKVKLQQELEKEDSPFAITQSKEYESINKRIEQLDKQIQQLKSSADKEVNSASEASSLENRNNDENNKTINNVRQFDEFVRSEDQPKQPSAGIYSISYGGNGKHIVSFDKLPEEKEEEEENIDLNIL